MARSFLILHGYLGSGPDHWQTWLAGRLRDAGETVAYPDLPAPSAPDLPAWRDALERALARPRPSRSCSPTRSPCVLWLHHCAPLAARRRAARCWSRRRRAPAHRRRSTRSSPRRSTRRGPAAADTRLVCAPDDPYCPEDAARCYGEPLGIPVDVLPGAGHINPEAGFGPWPEVEAWCYGASAITSSRIAPG